MVTSPPDADRDAGEQARRHAVEPRLDRDVPGVVAAVDRRPRRRRRPRRWRPAGRARWRGPRPRTAGRRRGGGRRRRTGRARPMRRRSPAVRRRRTGVDAVGAGAALGRGRRQRRSAAVSSHSPVRHSAGPSDAPHSGTLVVGVDGGVSTSHWTVTSSAAPSRPRPHPTRDEPLLRHRRRRRSALYHHGPPRPRRPRGGRRRRPPSTTGRRAPPRRPARARRRGRGPRPR